MLFSSQHPCFRLGFFHRYLLPQAKRKNKADDKSAILMAVGREAAASQRLPPPPLACVLSFLSFFLCAFPPLFVLLLLQCGPVGVLVCASSATAAAAYCVERALLIRPLSSSGAGHTTKYNRRKAVSRKKRMGIPKTSKRKRLLKKKVSYANTSSR